MNNLIDNFSNRLNTAIRIRSIKPIELSELTGIDKSKISSYMSGRYKAKQDGLFLLAKALGVSEAWLMGYDVPMEIDLNSDNNLKQELKSQYGESSIQLLDNYNKLNDIGKQKANENIEDLTKISEYTETKNEPSNVRAK